MDISHISLNSYHSMLGFPYQEETCNYDEVLRNKIHSLLQMPDRHFAHNQKCEDMAKKYIEEGNESLEQDSYRNALKAFTKSLQHTQPNSTNEAWIYSRRSLVLERLKAYDESIADIERVLKITEISGTLRYEQERRRKTIEEKRKKEKRSKTGVKQDKSKSAHDNEAELTLFEGENEKVVGMSKALKIEVDEETGRRYVVTTKAISPNDVLLKEEPFFIFWDSNKNGYTVCDYCHKHYLAPISCKQCAFSLYCSDTCQSKAWKSYHREECPISFLHHPTVIRLLMILTNQGANFKEVVDSLRDLTHAEGMRSIGFNGNKFNGKSLKAVVGMMCDKSVTFTADVIEKVALLAVSIKKKTNFLNGSNDLYDLAKLIYHIFLKVKFEKHVTNGDYGVVPRYTLFPTYQLFNHSCIPNAISYEVNEKYKVVRACQEIPAGAEVSVNFLGNCVAFHPTKGRQFELISRHLKCKCAACQNSWDFKFKYNKQKLKIPSVLNRRLLKYPLDIASLWELLKAFNHELTEPCSELAILKVSLSKAYQGHSDPMIHKLLDNLDIL